MIADEARNVVDTCGFMKVPNVLTAAEVAELISKIGDVSGAGIRGALRIPAVNDLAHSPKFLDLARPHLGPRARPVRAICFDKSAETNWLVSWHQDLTLAVRARAEVEGFGPWSVKDGVPHVQAPAELLEQMLTLRLHLDDCDESNGALRVLSGSHRFGRVTADRVPLLAKQCPEVVCKAEVGEVLAMRPLLLHCSGRSHANGHRRVLHVEFAGFELPEPLQWAE